MRRGRRPRPPWKVTTNDGCEWHTATEADADIGLAAFVIGRAQDMPDVPALPEGAVMI